MGSYHSINQDAWQCYADHRVAAVAVSDGLGSKTLSQYGSAALCESVMHFIQTSDLTDMNCNQICEAVYQGWCALLQKENMSPDDCCATALFCLVYEDEVLLFQLGDGMAGVLMQNGAAVLLDDKSEHYINETDCLCSEFDISLWKYRRFSLENFCGALLCTDGIGIAPDTEEGFKHFTEDFIRGYYDMESSEIIEDIRGWLADWSGTDDKTIAFIINE